MDRAKTEKLIRFVLLTAADVDWVSWSLGPIHLIKYIYLADLAYAKANNGQTYTGIEWRFHKFGPWSFELYEIIISETALETVKESGGFYKYSGVTDYDTDYIRWSLKDETLRKELEKEINSIFVTAAIRRYLKEHGNNTYSLLHDVYATKPMLKASPGEMLDFTPEEKIRTQAGDEVLSHGLREFSATERKKLQAIFDSKFATKKNRRRNKIKIAPPRYDQIFFEAMDQLDDFEIQPVEDLEGTLEISEDVWKSPTRTDELP